MSGPFRHNLQIAFLFSISVNVLFLVAPIYMLQVYDRVLTSGSKSTLYSLSLIACFLLMIFAFADAGRKRSIAKAGHIFSNVWTQRLAKHMLSVPSAVGHKIIQQDIERVTAFLQNGGVLPLLDLPFAPLFFLVLFLLHPIIGWIGVVGVIILILFALFGERVSGQRILADQKESTDVQRLFKSSFESSSAIIAHGMRDRVLARWLKQKRGNDLDKVSTLSITGLFSGLSKSLRQILQTLILGAGAYMVLQQQMSPGAMIAGSIIIGRGLAPIDQIIGSWRSISLAREAWTKIRDAEDDYVVYDADAQAAISTPRPETGVKVSRLAITVPGSDKVLVSPINYEFLPGKSYALIGESGCGKTSLLRALAGVSPPRSGTIHLGERDIYQWPEIDRGQHVGYLPQSIELVAGTVADNIDRFTGSSDAVLHACCRKVGALTALSALPEAFETRIEPDRMTLSAGQQQIIGLARCWFGNPAYIVLDEPTSNLDPELSNKVLAGLKTAAKEGAVIIVATHDPKVILHVDFVLTLSNQMITAHDKIDYINMVKAGAQRRMQASGAGEMVNAK